MTAKIFVSDIGAYIDYAALSFPASRTWKTKTRMRMRTIWIRTIWTKTLWTKTIWMRTI